MFILRPATEDGPPLPDGYDSERLPRSTVLRYALKAAVNLPRDPATLVRRESLQERARRQGMLEWLPIHTHASSGSSGDPVPVMFTHFDLHHVLREMASPVMETRKPDPRIPKFRWDDRKLSIFPGAPHVAFYAPVIAKILVGTPSFETFGGAVIPTERQITMFAAGGFQTLLAIPSYLVYWLRRAIEMQRQGKVGPLKRLRRVVLGAEPVSEPLREHIVQLAAGSRCRATFKNFADRRHDRDEMDLHGMHRAWRRSSEPQVLLLGAAPPRDAPACRSGRAGCAGFYPHRLARHCTGSLLDGRPDPRRDGVGQVSPLWMDLPAHISTHLSGRSGLLEDQGFSRGFAQLGGNRSQHPRRSLFPGDFGA